MERPPRTIHLAMTLMLYPKYSPTDTVMYRVSPSMRRPETSQNQNTDNVAEMSRIILKLVKSTDGLSILTEKNSEEKKLVTLLFSTKKVWHHRYITGFLYCHQVVWHFIQ